jgi:hypothetical protein
MRPAVALALIGVMLATGCDSDDGSSPPTTSNPSMSSASPSPTATPTGEQIRLPDDITLDFDWTPIGDVNADAAVQAVIQLERAQTAVVAYGDRDAAPYTRYVTGAARTVVEEYFDANIDAGLGVTGTNRYFGFETSHGAENSVRVIFCVDGWDFFAKDRSTGEVFRVRDPRGGVRVTDTVKRSGAGQWRVHTTSTQEGVPKCRLEH